ncbi:MAG: 3,4-dihydroxy-2-butanone-4-phosphate synthase [Deltaproteobacteria bacterium]|nr:3,4-dihydroxy-2-butanone-4-phosphate synthase [Deltaproteobacteria bacterium]
MDKTQKALERLQSGRMIILIDDEDRENEGDLVCAAELITPEHINFMSKYGRGLICLALEEKIVDQLDLPLMVSSNHSRFGTNFTISIEARSGVTSGISAFDRAKTIRTAVARQAKPSDLVSPGHVFPLRARAGGVLVRAGQTEGSTDLMYLAGLRGAAVICEILHDDGTMARLSDLEKLSQQFDIPIISIAEIISYRLRHERLVRRVAEAKLPTRFSEPAFSEFKLIVYENDIDQKTHLALVRGDLSLDAVPLVRMHSGCTTGDLFGSLRCDCGEQLKASLRQISLAPSGALLYMQQEGRGIGLVNKIKSYALQDQGYDTVEANEMLGFKPDLRDYGLGAQMLLDLGILKLRLLTNNPKKIVGLSGYGLEIVERVPIQVDVRKENVKYLTTKREKLGHWLELPSHS